MAVLSINAQTVFDIVVKYPTEGNLVQYFPYSTVRVIDNRVDTTKIYTRQTGMYPLCHVNFSEPAAVVIKKYIDSSVRNSTKGTGELLINIEQLYIANIHRSLVRYTIGKRTIRPISFRRRGEHIGRSFPRGYVYLQATVWYKNEQGNYNKLLTLSRKAGHSNYQFDNYTMQKLIGNCIKAIALKVPDVAIDFKKLSKKQRALVQYTVRFPDINEEKNIPFEQINVNVRTKWKDYPVVKDNSAAPGICYVFDDFQNNKVTPANIQMTLNAKDSLYYISAKNDSLFRRKPHWGVYDGASWYINFSDSSYFKLNKQGDTYGFYIPRNLPDMYAMLSIQENQISSNSSPTLGGGNSGGFLIGLAALLVAGAIEDRITNKENRKMEKGLTAEGLRHNYRYCTLDMDNGDILYNDK